MTREAAAHELVVSAVAYHADMAMEMPEVADAASLFPLAGMEDWRDEASRRADDGLSPYERLYAARIAWDRVVKGEA